MSDDIAKYYRKDWMSDDQWSCALMFADVVGGFHHVLGKFHPCGGGVKINSSGSWATFDSSRLTALIVLAHDRMIRVELVPSGPGMIGFAMWKRHSREGSISKRHPTIEDAVKMHRQTSEEPRHD